MKKNYVVLTIAIASIIVTIAVVNIKERRKRYQTNDLKVENSEMIVINDENESISVKYKGQTINITEKNDVNTIKNILLNLKFDEWSTDSIISFIVTFNNEDYAFKNQGTTVEKKGDREAYLINEDSNKILDIMNKYGVLI